MKKHTPLLMLLFVVSIFSHTAQAGLPALVHSHDELLAPSIGGANGGLRLLSAQRPYTGELGAQFGFHIEYFDLNDLFASGEDTSRFIAEFSTNFVLTRYLEVFAQWNAFTNTEQSNDDLLQQLGNFEVGAKLGFDPWPFLSLAAAGWVEYLDDVGDLNQTSTAWNFRPAALITLDLTRIESRLPLRFHGNVGYSIDNSSDLARTVTFTAEQRFLLRSYPDNYLFFGVGMEVPADFVNFIVEYSSEQPIESNSASFLDNPQRVTVGIRAFPTKWHNLSLDAGADIKVGTGDTSTQFLGVPDYNLIFGMTFSLLSRDASAATRVAKDTGRIAGIVLDDQTAAPIGGAIISFPNMELTRLQSHPEKGTFVLSGLSKGALAARVEHPDYEVAEVNLDIKSNQTINPEIRLKKKRIVKKGLLMLKLTDADGKPLDGQLTFIDHPKMKPINIPKRGLKVRLPATTYKVAVSAEGYQTEEHSVTTEADGKIMASYQLRELSSKIQITDEKIVILDKIPFASGKALLQSKSLPLLNRVADVINDNPQLKKIRVEGHTDSLGKESYNIFLSQKRATAVMDYLVSRGVAKSRLEAVGYGPARPIASNKTKSGRATNRRVEFTIVEQAKPAPAKEVAPKPTTSEKPPAEESAAPEKKAP